MRKLAEAIQKARQAGADIPEDLERGLYGRARTLKRRERDRIKQGVISEERAQRQSERDALNELLDAVREDLDKLS